MLNCLWMPTGCRPDASACPLYGEPLSSIHLEVLGRESPSGVWMWFPARAAHLSDGTQHNAYGVAVVTWWNEREYTDIVPLDRTRWRVASDWWAQHGQSPVAFTSGTDDISRFLATWPANVKKSTFTKSFIQIPINSSIPGEEMLKRINNSAPVPFVEVASGKMSYIQLREFCMANPHLPVLQEEFLMSVPSIIREMVASSANCGIMEEFGELPPGVWKEVFSCLETGMQNTLRGVCCTWNDILDSASLTDNIIINSAEFEVSKPDRFVYYMTSPIYKCLRSSTQRIVCDASRLKDETDVFKLLDMIHYVARQNASVRLSGLYLLGFQWRFQIGSGHSSHHDTCELHQAGSLAATSEYATGNFCCFRLGYFVASLRRVPCEFIRFLSCTVNLDYVFFGTPPRPRTIDLSVVSRINTPRMQVTDGLSGAVWDALEAGLSQSRTSFGQPAKTSWWLGMITKLAGNGADYYGKEMCKA
ncbi:uncharacterized protein LOC129588783 [Paramacrobiotus metropolitanus]|uniref:uncharacterized protein LOC129588783 n=1 Tax=Paramacrobiotus metropolitanus TaxID=2943436 RepID=UPI002445842E|nr:uncharacterized protein LOC129588783 [Paramacrobiotus metropolitanus]